MLNPTTFSLHGESASWLSSLPRGQAGPYLNWLISTAHNFVPGPIEKSPPMWRASTRLCKSAQFVISCVPEGKRSAFVQALVEARMRLVADAKRLASTKPVAEVRALAVLGEEAAWGRQ